MGEAWLLALAERQPGCEARLTPLSPALAQATPREAVAAAAVQGAFTILDLFDALPWFKPRADWVAWRAFLAASFGLPMTPEEFAIFRECTGRTKAPTKAAREVNAIVGRRGGKSRVVGSVIVPYFALYRDYSTILGAGERCTIPVLAKNKDDAQALLGYCKATFALSAFKGEVKKELAEGLVLGRAEVDISIRAARITAARSRTVPVAACDEIAFWPVEDSAAPDKEILEGIRPAQLTVAGAMIFKLSSPYGERGVLFEEYVDHYAKDDDPILVWKATTLTMHPNNPQVKKEIEAAYLADAISAGAEFGANFRKDVQAFVTRDAVQAVTVPETQIAPLPGIRYFGFVDPSGGASDYFTFAVAHFDHPRQKVVLDLLYESKPPPFDPVTIVDVIVEKAVPFKLTYVTGDAYAGEWPRAAFLKRGLAYHVSDKYKREIYLNFLPLVNSKTVALLSSPRLLKQLVDLDRHTAWGGKDSIDHRPGAHDDVANSAAGSCVLASEQGRYTTDEKPEKQYLTPEGKPDFLAFRRDQMKELFEKDQKPAEDEGTPRYEYQP